MHFSPSRMLCIHPATHTQKSAFASLSEACYTAQKTYRLVLSKYVVSLRQAHTQDMVRHSSHVPVLNPTVSLPAVQMSLVRRVIEHMLSLYSYCNFSAQVALIT